MADTNTFTGTNKERLGEVAVCSEQTTLQQPGNKSSLHKHYYVPFLLNLLPSGFDLFYWSFCGAVELRWVILRGVRDVSPTLIHINGMDKCIH